MIGEKAIKRFATKLATSMETVAESFQRKDGEDYKKMAVTLRTIALVIQNVIVSFEHGED